MKGLVTIYNITWEHMIKTKKVKFDVLLAPLTCLVISIIVFFNQLIPKKKGR